MLLGLGLFFTAAFFSGRGAFLGEIGETIVTRLVGVIGIFLAPLAVFAGALVLLRRLNLRRAVGAGLILVAVTVTFAASLPEASRFDSGAYSEAGGIIGSAMYYAVYWTAGFIGAVLVLGALYLVGASLLTGVTLRSAATYLSDKARTVAGNLRSRQSQRKAGAKRNAETRDENTANQPRKPEESVRPEPDTKGRVQDNP